MAAGNFTMYNQAKGWFFDGTFDWDTDTHYAELLKTGYTPAATHDTWADVSAQVVVTGTQSDYAAQAMSGESVGGGTGVATVPCDAADVSFGTNVSLSAQYLVVRTGGATATGTDKLVGYVALDTATAVSSTNGSFSVAWNANGLWTVA
jgi:hypothetical protein